VALVFGGFLAGALALGFALRRSSRPELLGWLGPAAALGAAAAFVALGESSRRAAAPTVAVAQVVEGVAGVPEAAAHGLLAVYRPDSGAAEVGATRGGLFELDMAGLEGRNRRLILTDTDAWHWENLALPAGVRLAPFRATLRTGEPVAAVARFGPDGLEGRVAAGPFRNLGDALLSTPGGRALAARLGPDGAFRAGPEDALPRGQFLAGAVLNDRQQRRQELYRELLRLRPALAPPERRTELVSRADPLEGRTALLAWADPVDLGFTLAPEARLAGNALLVLPVRFERPAPGTRVTIPGPLVLCQRVLETGLVWPTPVSTQGADMHLRFQLPRAALPLQVERARLLAQVAAPSRRFTVSGRADGGLVELLRVESPLDPVRVEIDQERLLRLDAEGGLHLNLSLSSIPGGGRGAAEAPRDDKWAVEYLELEVSGRAL
jgi:hypothetical protein